MPAKKIVLDGREVVVDSNRYMAFDGLRGQIQAAFGADPQMSRMMTADAGEVLAFMVSQLAYTEAQAYEKLYQPMQFRDLVPVESTGGWADTIRYELVDYAGQGKRISGAGHDLPMAEVQFGEKTFPVVTGGVAYGYTFEELQKSAFFRTPLPTAKLSAAMLAAERHLNYVALYGEAASNLTGLYNNANVPQANAPTGNWAAATADQILADINAGILAVWTNTAYNDTVTDIVLPPAAMSKIVSTPRSANSDTTILEFIKKNNIAKAEKGVDINFRTGFGLNTAGSGSTKRALFYVRRTDRVKMHIPVELQFLSPQMVNLYVKVPGTYRYSGVEFRYPKSAYYMDNL
jgi:hypothetical protein